MATYKMKAVLAVETLGVLNYDFKGPLIQSNGPDDYVCPTCGNVLAKSVTLSDLKRFENMAIKCSHCSQVSKL